MRAANKHWTDQYIGTLYTVADCAEMCARVAREVFGRRVSIPSARTHGGRDLVTMRQMMGDHVTPIDKPEEGAVVVLRHGVDQRFWHVGTLTRVGREWFVLHAVRNFGSTVLTRASELRNMRLHLDGYYRWK
jgi:hypothetical protein